MKNLFGIFTVLLLQNFPMAQVIEINEWENLTQPGWVYTSNRPPIDYSAGSPAGGGAISFKCDAGTYTSSTSGGAAEFPLPPIADMYAGHWVKWSPGFTWNSIGTKIDYAYLSESSPVHGYTPYMTLRVGPNAGTNGKNIVVDFGIDTPHSRSCNLSIPIFVPGQWYWIEVHAKLNDAGTANGLFELWVNDMPCAKFTDITFRDRNTQMWKIFKHAPVWGGGGGTIAVTQYQWVDHTVISSKWIGMPGGPGPTPLFYLPDPIAISVRAGTSFGRKIQYMNPLPGTQAVLTYINKPTWVTTVGDSFFGTAPGTAGKYTFQVVLNVNSKAYDTLSVQLVASGSSAIVSHSNLLQDKFEVQPTGTSGKFQFRVDLDRPGDFRLAVFNILGAKAWEFCGTAPLPGHGQVVQWSPAKTIQPKATMAVYTVVLEQNGNRMSQRFVAK